DLEAKATEAEALAEGRAENLRLERLASAKQLLEQRQVLEAAASVEKANIKAQANLRVDAAVAEYLNSAERTRELDKLYDYGYDTGFDACLTEVKKLYPTLNLDALSSATPAREDLVAAADPDPRLGDGPSS
ncbi:hypothetical protein PJP10_31345, partial [Mycobacterium kansasii]